MRLAAASTAFLIAIVLASGTAWADEITVTASNVAVYARGPSGTVSRGAVSTGDVAATADNGGGAMCTAATDVESTGAVLEASWTTEAGASSWAQCRSNLFFTAGADGAFDISGSTAFAGGSGQSYFRVFLRDVTTGATLFDRFQAGTAGGAASLLLGLSESGKLVNGHRYHMFVYGQSTSSAPYGSSCVGSLSVELGLGGGVREVAIDVKPGSDVNPINMKAKGKLTVAVLGSADLGVDSLDVSSLVFAGARVAQRKNGTLMAGFEDVDGDGFDDLVLHFPIQDLNLTRGDVFAELTGRLADGGEIVGSDNVLVK